MKIFQTLFPFLKAKFKYDKIKNDPSKRESSKYFGITSIVSSILALICAVIAAILFAVMPEEFVLFLLCLLFGIAFGIAALEFLIVAIIDLIYQFKLNNKKIRWWALGIIIISIILLFTGVALIIINL